MRIGYKSVRHHSDGRLFDDEMTFMKSPEDAVRRIVCAELLFGTTVQVKDDVPAEPYREVTLTTSVLGTVDTTTLHFYKHCAPATALFELTCAFCNHTAAAISERTLVSTAEAAYMAEQFGARTVILAIWLKDHLLVIPETATKDDLVVMLELLIHGHSSTEINQLVA